MRDRLIKLIKYCTSCEECREEDIADHLLANGVIVPPCKVDDTIYRLIAEDCEKCDCYDGTPLDEWCCNQEFCPLKIVGQQFAWWMMDVTVPRC